MSALMAAVCVAGCGTAAEPPAAGDLVERTAPPTAVTTTAAMQAPPSTGTPAAPPAPPAAAAPASSVPAPAAARPAPSPPPAKAMATTSPAPAPAPLPPAEPPPTEPFESSVRPIDDAVATRMSASWRPGCPVGLDDLRLLTMSHWGFDGRPRTGELVVAARHADAVVGVFAALFRARFPIEQMRLVDEFGADDDRSMEANNTSAFNCRTVDGSDRWSEHAFGAAVDVNPVQNPYVSRSGVSPPAGAAYTTRQASTPGLITRDGPVVAAFAAIGWGWGGSWSSGRDYQHFSASGR